MKLLITNNEKFHSDANSFELAKEIHKKTLQKLSESVTKGFIPITLISEYSDGKECVVFEFDKKVDDYFFYTYTTKSF